MNRPQHLAQSTLTRTSSDVSSFENEGAARANTSGLWLQIRAAPACGRSGSGVEAKPGAATRSTMLAPLRMSSGDGAFMEPRGCKWRQSAANPSTPQTARTLDTGLPMIVCNRTGCDHDTQLFGSESAVVDRGEKLLRLRAPEIDGLHRRLPIKTRSHREVRTHQSSCLGPSDAETSSRTADWRCRATRSQTTTGRKMKAE